MLSFKQEIQRIWYHPRFSSSGTSMQVAHLVVQIDPMPVLGERTRPCRKESPLAQRVVCGAFLCRCWVVWGIRSNYIPWPPQMVSRRCGGFCVIGVVVRFAKLSKDKAKVEPDFFCCINHNQTYQSSSINRLWTFILVHISFVAGHHFLGRALRCFA